MKKVGIVMGSISDYEVVKPAIDILCDFDIEITARVLSAHRTPEQVRDFSEEAEKSGIDVVIAAAGKAAHLGGVIAAYTTIPVIGLPVKSSTMDGLDSLLSIVQMPSSVPVATVAINGGLNAGLLAVQILGVKYPEVKQKLIKYKQDLVNKVLKDDETLQELLKKGKK